MVLLLMPKRLSGAGGVRLARDTAGPRVITEQGYGYALASWAYIYNCQISQFTVVHHLNCAACRCSTAVTPSPDPSMSTRGFIVSCEDPMS